MNSSVQAEVKITGTLRYKNAAGEVIKVVPFQLTQPLGQFLKDDRHDDNQQRVQESLP